MFRMVAAGGVLLRNTTKENYEGGDGAWMKRAIDPIEHFENGPGVVCVYFEH